MNYLVIDQFRNCYGRGYSIHVSGAAERNLTFYGYSIREAEKRFREAYGLKGKHFTKIYI